MHLWFQFRILSRFRSFALSRSQSAGLPLMQETAPQVAKPPIMNPEPFRPPLRPQQRVGRAGEAEAVACLQDAGYRILERNYRCSSGEVDIIAEEGEVLCFVEVKARSSLAFGLPRDAVTPAKRRKLARTASHYLMERVAADRAYRADVVEVAFVRNRVAGVRLLRGAFSLESELERIDG